jgi:hypothetical protein
VKRTGILLIVWFCFSAAFLLALEFFTLGNSVDSDHITAVVRQAFAREPGVFMWLAFSAGWLGGHLFWSGRKR